MSPSAPFFRFLPDEEATLQWGGSWAATLSAPLVVYLQGDLGAGKTTFTRGLLRGLGYGGAAWDVALASSTTRNQAAGDYVQRNVGASTQWQGQTHQKSAVKTSADF